MSIDPKYVQVQRWLLRRIRSGKLRLGQRLPSEVSLCRQLGVSRITVRRALTELARQGYLASRSGSGHVVRAIEPAPMVGILMNYPMFGCMQTHRPFSDFALMQLNALRLELRRRGGRHRLYVPEPHETEHQLDHAALLDEIDRGVLAGLITSGWPHLSRYASQVHLSDLHLSRKAQERGVPVVSITSRDVTHPSTGTDYTMLGYLGAEYFLQRGIDTIGLLTLDQRENPTRDGFRQALAEHGRRPRESWIVGVDHHDEHCGYEAFIRWWSALKERPRALVIDDDHTGKGAMFAATLTGAGTDDQLRIACQALRGANTFWPRPCVKLEVDPAAHAGDAVDKVMRMIVRPGVEPGRTWIPPRIVDSDQITALPTPVALERAPAQRESVTCTFLHGQPPPPFGERTRDDM